MKPWSTLTRLQNGRKTRTTSDKAVKETEEGMLFHNFDVDSDDPNKFLWTEIYRKSEDFLFHADNSPVQKYA